MELFPPSMNVKTVNLVLKKRNLKKNCLTVIAMISWL